MSRGKVSRKSVQRRRRKRVWKKKLDAKCNGIKIIQRATIISNKNQRVQDRKQTIRHTQASIEAYILLN